MRGIDSVNGRSPPRVGDGLPPIVNGIRTWGEVTAAARLPTPEPLSSTIVARIIAMEENGIKGASIELRLIRCSRLQIQKRISGLHFNEPYYTSTATAPPRAFRSGLSFN